MSTMINTYPVFESSQVLTSTQLNQLVAYLDQQNRLTRVKLIGMGIVCGLEVTYDDSGSNTQVILSKGTAITSEGFLITLGACETSYYRPYVLPEGVEYKPFGDPSQDVTLYELLKEMPEDTTGVELLDDPAGFLDDKFVLLFLECFDNDLRSCLGNTCDELGMDRIFTIRKLLISKDDLDVVLTRSGNVGGLYPDKFTLPTLVIPRALFDPNQPHSRDYVAFSERYRSTFQDSIYPALFGDLSYAGALSDSYSVYEPLLGPVYGFTNPFETAAVTALKNDWRAFFEGTSSPGPQYRGMQYYYDFLKDLILAYTEFKECAFDLMAECCPDMSLFPKHVMLGRANTTLETGEEEQTYRHRFAQPPIYNLQKHRLEKTISLHKRLVLMVEKFNLDLVNYPGGQEAVPIRITPSCEKKTRLSDRSIPYYYRSKEESPVVGPGTLEYYWDWDNSRMTSPATQPLVLGYENQQGDQSAIGSNFETPLYYDLDDYPLLRIEGHIGMDFQQVTSTIQNLVEQFNLPFHTIALQLDPNTNALEVDYSCGFEDIQEDYLVHRNLFCSYVNDLVRLYQFLAENPDNFFEGEEGAQDLERLREIVERLDELCSLLPGCVQDFDFTAFQQVYKDVLQLIIDFVLIHKELLDQVNIEEEDLQEIPIINGMIQRLSPILYKFLDLLFYTKFYRVYYAFRRREFYLQREALFSGYLQKHPGVEHQAGVYKGGTFILVYNSTEENEVIADFNLPYLCCDTNPCIPSCDDNFVLNLPPFARPDYAITAVEVPVDINVILNDFGLQGGNYSIDIASETTANDGQIEQNEETGSIRYTPAAGFTGIDTFQYQLTDQETNETDLGLVTVLVKEPGVDGGCYSREILTCWGIERVRSVLGDRDIDSPGMSDDEMVDALLASLRDTQGFTSSEIRGSTLESPDSRAALVDCLGFVANEYSYEEQEQLIVSYQNDNCGSGGRSCYSRAILECWGLQRVDDTLMRRGINVSDLTIDQRYEAILQNLASTGGFTIDEIRSSVLESQASRRDLLNCIGIPIDASTTYEQLEQLIVDYQNANCRTAGRTINTIPVTLEALSTNDVQTLLTTRNMSVPADATEEDRRDLLLRSPGGLNLARNEIMVMNKSSITNIMNTRGVTFNSRDTKQQLVDKLFEAR